MASGTIVERARGWEAPRGISILTAVNHKIVGMRWIVTAFVFFFLAGILALTMVTQRSRSTMDLLSADHHNPFFTIHGMTMMLFSAVPIMLGLGLYFVPLMIGSRDVAFPRLNAFGYWVYLFSGVATCISLFMETVPDAGQFDYTPLSGPIYSPQIDVDFYALPISFLGVANLVAALTLIITILKMRAPGMAVNRMPTFVWSIFIASLMIIFAMPPLMLTTIMLALDRIVGTHFFNVQFGGQSFLWQRLLWFFDHPEVYIVAIPTFGMVSTLLPPFARRPLVGYLPVVLSQIVIGIASLGLWVHHLFAGDSSMSGMSFSAAAGMAIAVLGGVQIFCWIATIWTGRGLLLPVPFLWAAAFIPLFVIGGIAGVMAAPSPLDFQMHDGRLVTAHFHDVLVPGAVFPLFGLLYYWFPKVTGRMLSERLGRWSFWLVAIGFYGTFFTVRFIGFTELPWRVHTDMPGRGWDAPMMIVSIGALMLGTGFFLSLVNAVKSLRGGDPAGDDPWEGGTLEWATASPPDVYNFRRIPRVERRMPLWYRMEEEGKESEAYELSVEGRETLGTSMLDAEPIQRLQVSGPSIWPLMTAIGGAIVFFGVIATVALVPVGAFIAFASVVAWNWPGRHREKERAG
jgi:cytochrome c oxidase subunit I+III